MAQVFLGMSGGVDSSAAAVLLQEQGYAVSGLHLSLLSGLPLPADRLPDDGSDARAVASLLGLPFYKLLAGSDPNKDQSYFLCRLTQEQLSRTLFPLGDLEKPAVRALAEAHGLINAQKRDSQDICFVPDGDYVSFITRCVGHESPTGPFVDREGRVLGQHKGFIRYTKGQHKGLGLAIEPPLYVLRKDPADHAVYLGHNEDLFTSELIAGDWNWISIPALTAPMTVTVKTRYSQREAEAVAEPLSGGQVRLRFREPQRAVTPGQFVVLYDGDAVVGGGVILE